MRAEVHAAEESRIRGLPRHAWDNNLVTWGGLVLKNLLRRKARTALTVAGVAIGVGLIVALLSITAGVKRRPTS